MPPKPSPFPGTPELGTFEHLYENRAFSILRLAAYAACAMTVGLGVLALWTKQSLDRSSDIYYQFVNPIAIGLFILGFVCLLGGLLHKVKENRIALYQEGAILEADGKMETILWSQVQHYFNTSIGDPFRFTTVGGGQLEISNETVGFGALCAAIRLRSGEAIFDREWRAVTAGNGARFGPILLTREGFHHEGQVYRWSDVQKMYSHIINGHATLAFEIDSFLGIGPRIPTGKIPSVDVCIRIIEQLAPQHLLAQAQWS